MAEVKPRYAAIAAELRARIVRGDLRRGDRLPPQRALAREFGVTVMTLRQALDLLARDGLLDARRGAGTYVGPPAVAYGLGGLRSFAQELAAQGLVLETRVLSAGPAAATAAESAALGLRGLRVFEIERLRLASGGPVALQRSLLAPALGRRIARADLGARSLYDVLAEAGLAAERAEETLRPVIPGPREAALLGLEDGAAAFLSERLTFGHDDRRLVLDVALLAGDRVLVSTGRLAGDVTVRYRLEPGGLL